jgi:hypothetical protein
MQLSYKVSCRARKRSFPLQDLVPIDIGPIEGFISALVYLNHCSVEADSCKNTFAAGVRKDLRVQLQISPRSCASADESAISRRILARRLSTPRK